MFGIGMISSCSDYLESDQYFKDRLTLDKVFTSEEYTEQWLAHTFSFLREYNQDVTSKHFTPHCFADDMYYGDRDETLDIKERGQLSYSRFKLGEYNENEKQGGWGDSYKGIRNATIFIPGFCVPVEHIAVQISTVTVKTANTGPLPHAIEWPIRNIWCIAGIGHVIVGIWDVVEILGYP